MWESICLTLIATAGNNIGKVLQKKGTVILPPLSFKLKVIKAYASNKAWFFGFLMDIFGALLMLRALSQAPPKAHHLYTRTYLDLLYNWGRKDESDSREAGHLGMMR
ncbi:hypothetical protein QJS10_CPA07g00983 [Acorus calamus]|uniref:Magnesium transporter n=1 Tax=Acorus calamus TaxID=4465 RepID=A0AAV9EEW4_ACOCL|nr:hypothetical protein QJS10_CPA07g00983 [Acorus calamus]